MFRVTTANLKANESCLARPGFQACAAARGCRVPQLSTWNKPNPARLLPNGSTRIRHACHSQRNPYMAGPESQMPAETELRKCQDLMFDFEHRFLDMRRYSMLVTALDLRDDGRQSLLGLQSYFELQQELTKGVTEGNLLRCALLASQDPHVAHSLHKAHEIGTAIKQLVKPTCSTRDKIRFLNTMLFEVYKFRGAREQFYHPDNHSVHKVLHRRTGGPTAFGILYMKWAGMLGVRLAPISLPSHLLLQPLDPGAADMYIDPHDDGRIYSRTEIGRILTRNLQLPTRPPTIQLVLQTEPQDEGPACGSGTSTTTQNLQTTHSTDSVAVSQIELSDQRRAFDNGSSLQIELGTPGHAQGARWVMRTQGPLWYDHMLQPASHTEVLLRLLRNFREVYWVPLMRMQVFDDERRKEWQCQQALSVLRLMRAAQPHASSHYVDEALCLAALGRHAEGRQLLRSFQQEHPECAEVMRALFLLEKEARTYAQLEALFFRPPVRRVKNPLLDTKHPSFDSAFYSRMFGRLWDDNYWISALLEEQGGDDDDDDKDKKSGKQKK